MTIDKGLGHLSARLRQKIRNYVSASDYARSAFDNPAPVLDGLASFAGPLLLECVKLAQSEAEAHTGHAPLPAHAAKAFMVQAGRCAELACKQGEATDIHRSPAANMELAADGIAGCAGYLINALESAPAERAMRLGLMNFSALAPGVTVSEDWTPTEGSLLILSCDLLGSGEHAGWPMSEDSARRFVAAAVALNLAGTTPSMREEMLDCMPTFAQLATELITSTTPPVVPIRCGSVEVSCRGDFIGMSLYGDGALIAEATINGLTANWPVPSRQIGNSACDILPANLHARLQDLGIADAAKVVIAISATLLDSTQATKTNSALPKALTDATAAARQDYASFMIQETCDYLCRYIAQEVALQDSGQGTDIAALAERLRVVERPAPAAISTASIGDYVSDLLGIACMALIASRQQNMDMGNISPAQSRSENVTPFRKTTPPADTH